MTCPPELRHACASAAIAVVLPVPAGASASATRRPAGGHLRDQRGLAGVERAPPRRRIRQRQFDIGGGGDAAVAAMHRGQDAPLGGQRFAAGVDLDAVAAVDAGAVAATQRDRLTQLGVGDAGVRHRKRVPECGIGEAFDQCDIVRHVVCAGHPQRFGAHVVALPGGAGFATRGDEFASTRRDPFLVDPTASRVRSAVRPACRPASGSRRVRPRTSTAWVRQIVALLGQ